MTVPMHACTVQLKGNLILDTRTHAPGWIFSGEDYIMLLIFNGHPLHSCPYQPNHLACTPANVTLILNKLFSKTYNINSIYTMNLRILSLYVLIEPWIHYPTEKLLDCSISCPTVWLDVENGFGVENGSFIGNWISSRLASQLVRR